jgi:hypothetical protein
LAAQLVAEGRAVLMETQLHGDVWLLS